MVYDRFVLPPPPSGDAGNGKRSFVSRGGEKLEGALRSFAVVVEGRICADLGANVGGFTDCLLQHGARKVYAVDTAYGVLAWTLRKDPRVVVRERTNVLHMKLDEAIEVMAIDVGWTRQDRVLPAVAGMMGTGGDVLTLIKPHYESEAARAQRGVLTAAQSRQVVEEVAARIAASGWDIRGIVQSPLEGQKGNTEFIAWLRKG